METEALLLVFVGVSVVSILIQSISLWMAARSVRGMSDQIKRQSAELERRLSETQSRLLEAADGLKPVGEMADNISRNLNELTLTIRTRAEDVDRFVGELTEMGREQATKVDYLVNDTVEKFEQTTESIQKDVLRPVMEVAAFARGIKAGIDVLLAGSNRKASEKGQEEELFI